MSLNHCVDKFLLSETMYRIRVHEGRKDMQDVEWCSLNEADVHSDANNAAKYNMDARTLSPSSTAHAHFVEVYLVAHSSMPSSLPSTKSDFSAPSDSYMRMSSSCSSSIAASNG